METIKLSQKEWIVDTSKPLGKPGGFGAVFEGKAADGTVVAVKRLHLKAADFAHRELRIAEELMGRPLQHVIPFFDAGQDAESDQYFLVMPLAEKDLQSEIDLAGAFPEEVAVSIAQSIVQGLLEVPELVHRDLKPRNILFHEGKWKVADFGIARFVEESTSSHTLKAALSAAFAAPEQWQHLHATHATDVYALGCLFYVLLTGAPPFSGHIQEDYREQHLHAMPPKLDACSPELRGLLAMMLRKPPESRPTLQRVQLALSRIPNTAPGAATPGKGAAALAQAGASDAERQAELEARKQYATTVLDTRKSLAETGFAILSSLFEDFVQEVKDRAPTATVKLNDRSRGQIRLGIGCLEWGGWPEGNVIAKDAFQLSKWDVVAGATLRVVQETKPSHAYGSSLWYMRRSNTDAYRWYEVSYMTSPLASRQAKYEPFEVTDLHEADLATSNVMHVLQRAFGPQPIDDEDASAFADRWLLRLADASSGGMQRPRSLPLD